MEILINNMRYVPEKTTLQTKTEFNILILNARKLKYETLDEASGNMGIAKSQLWSMEKGETEPKLKMLQKVLKYYGLTFEEIK